jgi:NTE family protein
MTAKPIALALQGGGAHGAFTWGVLDKLLEDGRLDIKAISGTSAGAMNAAVLAQGFAEGGPDKARETLETFWRSVSRLGAASPIRRSFIDMLTGNWSMDQSAAYNWFDLASRVVSPYDANPLDINPLLDLLEQTIDFDQVHCCQHIKLFVSATNVRTGKIKVFEGHELTPAMVMASACLPRLFKAVEIDGEHYWDGGFMGNPPIFPIFYKSDQARHRAGADQPDRAGRIAPLRARHRQPAERDHLQLVAAERIAGHKFRGPADRRRQADRR